MMKNIPKESFFVFLALMLMLIPFFTYIVHFFVLYLIVSKGKEWFFKGLFFIFLMRFENPIFHPVEVNFSLLTVLTIFIIMLFKYVKIKKITFSKLERKFYILIVLILAAAFLGSMLLTLSVVRLLLFSIVVFTVFRSVELAKEYDFLSFLNNFTILFVLISFPLIFLSYGYPRDLYAGITNHSQSLGVIFVPIYIIYFIQYLSKKIIHTNFHRIILVLGAIEIVLSGSRTAVVSVVGVIVLFYIVNFFVARKSSKKELFYQSIFVVAMLIVLINFTEDINSKVQSFVLKSSQQSGSKLMETVPERIFLAKASINNFISYPYTGIGFGVQIDYWDPAEADVANIKYLPGTNIMYSKPLEKGNLYLSVFEETGLIAGLYFLLLLLYLLIQLIKSGDLAVLMSYIGILIIFNGEATLFAPAGMGNYQLLLLAIFFQVAMRKRKTVNESLIKKKSFR
ncbi:O-antigen ligase family protein [Sulfurovum sp.]|uniref:O-antigen ligase family protein n=1 Tax=Sulfurovum sp. TaxID=1969726 RepID=UPI003565F00C